MGLQCFISLTSSACSHMMELDGKNESVIVESVPTNPIKCFVNPYMFVTLHWNEKYGPSTSIIITVAKQWYPLEYVGCVEIKLRGTKIAKYRNRLTVYPSRFGTSIYFSLVKV